MNFVYSDGGRSNYFKGKHVGDCVTRAICNATGLDYKKVYDDLKSLNNGISCRNGTPVKVAKRYIEKILGWKWVGVNRKAGESLHLNANELPSGNLILRLSKHLTNTKNGVIYDTYNCSTCYEYERTVYGYWKQN